MHLVMLVSQDRTGVTQTSQNLQVKCEADHHESPIVGNTSQANGKSCHCSTPLTKKMKTKVVLNSMRGPDSTQKLIFISMITVCP